MAEYLMTIIAREDIGVRECIERAGVDGDLLLDTIFGATPVTEGTAPALARLFGRPPHFWLNLQANYDRGMELMRKQA